MAIQDVNQDGLPDLVVLIPYEKIKVLLQKTDGDFEEEDVDPPGGTMERPWLTSVDVDGDGKPELLLPQKNFVRAVVLEKETETAGATNRSAWVFRVKDQINGSWSDSRIVGATALRNGTNMIPSIFLLDAEHGCLTLCERDAAGVWQVKRNVQSAGLRFQRSAIRVPGRSGHAQHCLSGPKCRGLDVAGWRSLGPGGARWL